MFDENKYKVFCYEEKNADGSARCPVICAMSTYAGKNVKGYAKLNEGDEWNWETGKALAIARCNTKIAENFCLGCFSNTTGVKDHYVTIFGLVRRNISPFLKHSSKLF